jgi:hypothetical protein
MNLVVLRATLQTVGYDATIGDALHAFKVREDAYAYELVIDHSGQSMFTAKRVIQPAHPIRATSILRNYSITRERQVITVIRYELRPDDDIKEIVRELERLALRD